MRVTTRFETLDSVFQQDSLVELEQLGVKLLFVIDQAGVATARRLAQALLTAAEAVDLPTRKTYESKVA